MSGCRCGRGWRVGWLRVAGHTAGIMVHFGDGSQELLAIDAEAKAVLQGAVNTMSFTPDAVATACSAAKSSTTFMQTMLSAIVKQQG